ncbi:glycosyltransferase family 4 protein [Nonlabens marinus]|uniref:Alpha-1,4-N-acetylgalactosamine transferase PglH n=1 Tax=Nonlabens marinus S1-08 TaxID=1454201 RepID=W8VQM5_9FLAO|nr:glycosyltransferase family 4 protein [Nonlabens marinus]BAO55754.1 alpha-1,4-N-acetylgalactosamine transferase PglH [Nonlabens marinus S1-08]
MRVLQIIDTLHPGGAERMAVQIANGLVGIVELSALCCTREEGFLKQQLHPEVVFLFANREGQVGFKGIFRINKFIKAHRITHIHAHSSSIYTSFLLAFIFPKLKIIWHDHYGNAQFLENRPIWKIKLATKKVDAIISVNPDLKNWAFKNELSKNLFYLPNFVEDRGSDTKEVSLPGIDGKRIVCLANLRLQKNHALLLKAWKELHYIFPEWNLLLVGKGFEDDYQEMIESLIHNNQLATSVHLLGARTDIDEILSSSDIAVLSSSSEGLPLALLEYGLAGLPVVVTDVGACKEVVQGLGKVVPAENVDALKLAVSELIETPELRATLGAAFQKHVRNTYGAQNYLNKLLDIYQRTND